MVRELYIRCYDDAIRCFYPLNVHLWKQEGFSHILGSSCLGMFHSSPVFGTVAELNHPAGVLSVLFAHLFYTSGG